jgi:hypothetical protein
LGDSYGELKPFLVQRMEAAECAVVIAGFFSFKNSPNCAHLCLVVIGTRQSIQYVLGMLVTEREVL